MEINLTNSIAYCEALGLSKVWKAYADDFSGEDIFMVGFNPHSGYVYLSLENGTQILSCLGREVEYMITDWNTGEEFFFNSVNELELHNQEAI